MRCTTPTGRPSAATLVGLGAILFVAIGTAPVVGLEPGRLAKALPGMADFLRQLVRPPDPAFLPKLGGELLETVEIAWVATALAAIISLPLAFLAARNAAPVRSLSPVLKGVLALLRSLPELLLALIFASSLGLGVLPGLAALAVSSVAFMAKAYAESLEVVEPGPVEAVAAHGGSWLAARTVGMLPQAYPDLISFSLYWLDVNVRSATVLGLVGAGGIGFTLAQAQRLFQYERLTMLIVAIYLTVAGIDRLSDALRRRILG